MQPSESNPKTKTDLGRQLLVQQATDPEKRARYQREVDAMLEKLRLEDRWMGVIHTAVLVLFLVLLVFGAGSLVYFTVRLAAERGDFNGFTLLTFGWALLFGAALALLWHLHRRMQLSDVLVHVKVLERRLLELEERALVVRAGQ
jgi:uncharacterized membrane protein YciS (DUF1049 family)